MKTRIGKIARLAQDIREQLNRRLVNGEPSQAVLVWLNAQRPVRKVLRDQFARRPVTKQNLSEWRQGGYRDWRRHQESRDAVRLLAERAEELDGAAQGLAVSDRLSAVLAAELGGPGQDPVGGTH